MLTKRFISIILFLLIPFTSVLWGQHTKMLFLSDSILDLKLELPLKKVLNDRKERNKQEATLSYKQENGALREIKIRANIRGNTRTLRRICTFPPLRLNFKKSKTKNSIFEGQKKIKLVTHCKNERSYEIFVLKEYLVYKLYQLVTPYSFNVRLCRIIYTDVDRPGKKPYEHYAFLIEDIDDVADRNQMREYKDSIRLQEVIEKDALDKLMFFQFMIGNHDWSIEHKHNTKIIIGDKAQLPIAVPYDFDYCGLINTPYALPPEETSLENVRERYFRGFCRSDGYAATIKFYKGIQAQVFETIRNADFLSERNQREMITYLNGFFKKLNDPRYIKRNINMACKVKHKHRYSEE